jgi:type II secretory pathway pseudopilin PulG
MNVGSPRLRSTLSRLHEQEGFTLVELAVAAMIVLVAVLALAYTATIGFSSIALARQRDGANGVANQMLEQIRGLPFDTVRKGLATSDLSGDPNIVACGIAKCYQSGSLTETIPTSNYAVGTNITPLVPHSRTVTAGPNTYTVQSYVTYYQDNKTQNQAYRAIVIVTWSNVAVRGASARVENQSILYSGNGCLSTATHPFAAPCQPFFYSSTVAGSGEVDVTGNLPGANFSRATLWPADVSSNMQMEQVASLQGTTQASTVSTLASDGSSEQFSNRAQVSSAADNDPVQSDPDYSTVSLPNVSTGTLTFSGSTGSLWVTSRSGDAGTTISTVTANPTTHACQGESDNLPCGSSTVFPGQNGSQKRMSTNLDLVANGNDLHLALLALMDSPSSQSLVFTDRNTASGSTRCVGTSGDGCVHAEGTLNFGQISLGGLPAGLPNGSVPVGWQGYFVQLSNFTETTTAEVGISAAAPSVSVSGTVSYWNGVGYTTISLIAGPSVPIPVAPLNITTIVDGKILIVSVRADANGLKTGGTVINDSPTTCGTPPVACRKLADATVSSPILGDILYTVTFDGQTLADLDIHTALGSLVSHGEYQPSPSG